MKLESEPEKCHCIENSSKLKSEEDLLATFPVAVLPLGLTQHKVTMLIALKTLKRLPITQN